jgi:hypothetical protein
MTIVFSREISKFNTADHNAFAELDGANATSSQQFVLVKSNTFWEGSILDSKHDYTIKGSYGDARFDIDCIDGAGPFSVVFNKQDGFGYLTLSLIKNGRIIDNQTTMDSFGGVQISGNCEVMQ